MSIKRQLAALDRAAASISSSPLPARTLDTMSDVIGISSPSGRTSKRSRATASERLRVDLFGKAGLARPTAEQPTDAAALRRQAAQLRELSARGMKSRAYARKADELEARADILEASPEDRIPHGIPGSCGHCAFWSSDPEAVRAHRASCTWREAYFQSGGTRPPYGG